MNKPNDPKSIFRAFKEITEKNQRLVMVTHEFLAAFHELNTESLNNPLDETEINTISESLDLAINLINSLPKQAQLLLRSLPIKYPLPALSFDDPHREFTMEWHKEFKGVTLSMDRFGDYEYMGLGERGRIDGKDMIPIPQVILQRLDNLYGQWEEITETLKDE